MEEQLVILDKPIITRTLFKGKESSLYISERKLGRVVLYSSTKFLKLPPCLNGL